MKFGLDRFGLPVYRGTTWLISPLAGGLLRHRLRRGKEDKARLGERLGYAGKARPDGTLIWIHGASVGETLAALPLLDVLLTPGRHALVTSGTVTAAQIMAERLPERALHQFVPLDTPRAVKRFLDHWKPDVGLFIDSDLWPNLLMQARQRMPLALVNARMSAKSAQGWARVPAMARDILSSFQGVLALDSEIAARFTALGARDVAVSGSLKADAPPLPADIIKLAQLKEAVKGRPVFLASSTHPGEDETLLPAHDQLRRKRPDLLTILVPRHPDRGGEIAMLCGTRKVVRRSTGLLPDAQTAIYVADTMGELGLFYRLARIVFMGGSLITHGGQNPLEPARLDCAVMAGPHTENFTAAYAAIFKEQGAGRVATSLDIASLVDTVLSEAELAQRMAEGAARGAALLGGAVAMTARFVEDILDKHAHA